jgi:hypothetical protein
VHSFGTAIMELGVRLAGRCELHGCTCSVFIISI